MKTFKQHFLLEETEQQIADMIGLKADLWGWDEGMCKHLAMLYTMAYYYVKTPTKPCQQHEIHDAFKKAIDKTDPTLDWYFPYDPYAVIDRLVACKLLKYSLYTNNLPLPCYTFLVTPNEDDAFSSML